MRKLNTIAAATLCAALCASCRVATETPVSVEPAPLTLTAARDGSVEQPVTFRIRKGGLPQRARLVITPQIIMGDTVSRELRPIVADGRIFRKKTQRLTELEGYTDPYADIALTADSRKASVALPYTLAYTATQRGTARLRAMVSADGCGECTGIDTLDLGTVTFKPKRKITVRRPKVKVRQKVHSADGTARLHFAINRYDIRPTLGRNAKELEKMAAALVPVLRDTTAHLQSITIGGRASVDGSLEFNTTLALNRANAARDWLVRRLDLTKGQQRLIKTESKPEGWEPVIAAMERDNHPDAARVRAIVDEHKGESDDVAEKIIRRLPCWKDIVARYLDRDRKVDYTYAFTVNGETEQYEDYDDMIETEEEVDE